MYQNIGRFLAARGFATAVISYRLLFDVDWRGQARRHSPRNRVRAEINRGPKRPAAAVFLMGHSTGAQLVTRIALKPEWLREAGGDLSGICGVVAASGPATT